jgi:tetratricopeptide (TPR) repeat protein
LTILFDWQAAWGNDNLEVLFNQGNQFFQQEQYEDAVLSYQKILDQGAESWEVYYNLGNAYFRIGSLGPAILNFERALRMAPDNEDVQHNIEVANLLIIDKIEQSPKFFMSSVIDNFAGFLGLKTNVNILGKVVLAFYLIFMVLLILRLLLRQPRIKARLIYGIIPALIVLIILTVSWQVVLYQQRHQEEAVILEAEVDVLGAPDASGKALFTIHEGTKVGIEKKIDQDDVIWLSVQLADGKTGWVTDTVLERI